MRGLTPIRSVLSAGPEAGPSCPYLQDRDDIIKLQFKKENDDDRGGGQSSRAGEAEIPWAVAYLREDIQDLRNEVRETRRLTTESYEKLDAKIDARTDELRQEMSELRREVNVQFRWMAATTVAVGGLIVAALKLLP